MLPDPAPDPVAERLVQGDPLPEPQKEHDPDVPLPILADHQAFHHLGKLLHLTVDLRRSDANPARIERGIAPSQDHQTVVGGEPRPVAVAPDPREGLEIRCPVPRAVRIVPECDRHAGKRPGAHQLAVALADGSAALVEDLDRHPQPARLELAGPDRRDRVPQREA